MRICALSWAALVSDEVGLFWCWQSSISAWPFYTILILYNNVLAGYVSSDENTAGNNHNNNDDNKDNNDNNDDDSNSNSKNNKKNKNNKNENKNNKNRSGTGTQTRTRTTKTRCYMSGHVCVAANWHRHPLRRWSSKGLNRFACTSDL